MALPPPLLLLARSLCIFPCQLSSGYERDCGRRESNKDNLALEGITRPGIRESSGKVQVAASLDRDGGNLPLTTPAQF